MKMKSRRSGPHDARAESSQVPPSQTLASRPDSARYMVPVAVLPDCRRSLFLLINRIQTLVTYDKRLITVGLVFSLLLSHQPNRLGAADAVPAAFRR